MRVFLLSLFAMICGMFSANASSDVTVFFEFNDPEAVDSFKIDWEPAIPTLTPTGYQLTIEDNNFLGIYTIIELKEGYMFDHVASTDGATQPRVINHNTMTLYIQPSDDQMKWSIFTSSLNEARTGSLTLTTDDPSKFTLRENRTELDYTLEPGHNIVKFIPGEENTLTVIPKSTYEPIYRVTVNGERLPVGDFERYTFTPHDGDEVKVLALFPDEDFPIHFSYSPGAENVITAVSVANASVTDFDGYELNVKGGSDVFIRLDDTNYQISKVTINSVPQSNVYSSLYFIPLEETYVYIEAHPYGDITAYVDVDDPANVTLYQGYAYEEKVISLVPGRNTLQLPERSAKVCAWHSGVGRVVSISDGENEYEADKYGLIQLTDGMTLTITTAPIQRDRKAVIWLDSKEDISSFTFNLGSLDFRTSLGNQITEGYNEILIDPAVDNPATLSWWKPGCEFNSVYVDDEQIAPIYSGGTNYDLPSLHEGSVVRIYCASQPERFSTTFNLAEGVGASIVRDRVVPVLPSSEAYDLLSGTEVTISPTSEHSLTVTRNEISMEPDENGCFTFTVDSASTIDITSPTIGISDITVSEDLTVFNLQGIKIMKCRKSDLQSLPSGIYIINGQKYRIK